MKRQITRWKNFPRRRFGFGFFFHSTFNDDVDDEDDGEEEGRNLSQEDQTARKKTSKIFNLIESEKVECEN